MRHRGSAILDNARRVLGDAVADACGPVLGLDDEGELRSVWRRSGHDRFWIHGGNFMLVRNYSKYLALQIQADLAGVDLPALGRVFDRGSTGPTLGDVR